MEREYSQKYLQLNRNKRIVFDAKELPWFHPRPDLTDLRISSSFRQKLEERYPCLQFQKPCIVDGAVLIQDLLAFPPYNFDFETGNTLYLMARELNRISDITIQVVDGALPNDFLLKALCTPALFGSNPMIIFPGEGAKVVSEYMRRQDPGVYARYEMDKAIYLPCQRTMIAQGKFEINVNATSFPTSLENKNIILIIDDVIASGQTVRTIVSQLRKSYEKLPPIVAISWFFIEPTNKENKNSPSGIQGVDMTITSFALKGNYVSRPPVNSLSCFVRSSEKYDQVKTSFMEKYINDQEKFLRFIEEMKGDL